MPCIDFTDTVRENHTPCSSSTRSYCCPDSYECRKNGLCTLPATANTSTLFSPRHGSYNVTESYGKHILFAQLPSCSSRKWRDCGFESGACSNSYYTGFVPTGSCYPYSSPVALDSIIPPGDWLDCWGMYRPSGTSTQSSFYSANCSDARSGLEMWMRPSGNSSGIDRLSPIVAYPNRSTRAWPDPSSSSSSSSTTGSIPRAHTSGPWVRYPDSYYSEKHDVEEHNKRVVAITVSVVFVFVFLMSVCCCWARGMRAGKGRHTGDEGDLEDEEVEMDERALEDQRRGGILPRGAVVRGGGDAEDEDAPPPYKPRPTADETSLEGGRLSAVGPPPPGYRSRFVWPERRRRV